MDYLLNCYTSGDGYVRLRGVLNLIINGLPSKPLKEDSFKVINILLSFKPYYKWITF